jgi:hypothetical protein
VSSSPEAGPIPVFVLGIATAPFFYAVLRWLRVAWPAAALAGLVVAVASPHAEFSGRVKPYVVECFVVLLLAFAVQRLQRARWTWWTAAIWTVGAVVIGTISVFLLVATAVATVVLALGPGSDDRSRRLVALVSQGLVQLVYFARVQRSFASDALAKDWGTSYEGYIELTIDPVELVRELGRHLSRLGLAVVGGGSAVALAVTLVAIVALAANSVRGRRSPVARFLLGLVVVAFVGAIFEQIPFGPNNYAGGFRASLWLIPSVLVGLAFAIDATYGWVRAHAPRVELAVSAATALVAVAIVVASAGDPVPYLVSGSRSATDALVAATDDDTAVIMFPLGVNPHAAEPEVDVEIVEEKESLIGFHVLPRDPRTWLLYYPPWDGSLEQVAAHVDGASRVVIYDGIHGFGDQQLPALERALGELGYTERSSQRYGFAQLSVWER